MADLYEMDGRDGDALQLVRRAIFLAQQAQAPEALYRWHWRSARLLRKTGAGEAALGAYERAIETIKSIRQDLALDCGRRGTTFRKVAGPLFFESADLQLQLSAQAKDEDELQERLKRARDTVELLKTAEIDDYFQDPCVNLVRSKSRDIDLTIDPGTAVVYLIPLKDRTELLVSLPGGKIRRMGPSKIGEAELTREAIALRRGLETIAYCDFIAPAKQIYDQLIRPHLEEELQKNKITTLIFVPDGPLRGIPMGALHDGNNYLIARYAVAVTPGLSLQEPLPFRRQRIQLLTAGMSVSKDGFPALENVPRELGDVQGMFAGRKLLNDEFRKANIEEQMNQRPYAVVHIATHGKFDSDYRKTFLVTSDLENLGLGDLERLIQPSQFRGQPVELLALSACQTAAGDDRAALGLAGVALKSGARSALATLWFVSDEASGELVGEFYRALRDGRDGQAVSKAQALQMAQLKVIEDSRFAHPGYWSPYLIIGNWK
jgi:CHAT domain-containing protein